MSMFLFKNLSSNPTPVRAGPPKTTVLQQLPLLLVSDRVAVFITATLFCFLCVVCGSGKLTHHHIYPLPCNNVPKAIWTVLPFGQFCPLDNSVQTQPVTDDTGQLAGVITGSLDSVPDPLGNPGGKAVTQTQTKMLPTPPRNLRDKVCNIQIDAEQEWKVKEGKKKGKRSTVKSQQPSSDPKTSPTGTDTPVQNPTPILKPSVTIFRGKFLLSANFYDKSNFCNHSFLNGYILI